MRSPSGNLRPGWLENYFIRGGDLFSLTILGRGIREDRPYVFDLQLPYGHYPN